MDRKSIIRKLLLGPADWITLSPFLLGVTVAFGAWAVSLESGIALAASVILILISAGIYFQRLLSGWNENYEKLVNEGRESIEKNRNDGLDRLYAELKKDGDPRTRNLLKDLRTLMKSLMNVQSESVAISAFDIISDADRLFHRSVDYLRESLELWNTAQEMQRASIKEQLLKQRESLIQEVEKNLENLGNVLSIIKKNAVNSRDGQQLAELREELNSSLKIAEEVEMKMDSLRGGRPSADEEKYLQNAK
ncbi:MAG: hypothetical protein WAX69_19955 [Victivallales bacterium]